MSRSLKLYLADILQSIGKIERYTANMDYEELVDDERTFDAVVHNLQIIGEAVKNIPSEIRDHYPQVKWRKIAGLRDIIAHAYFTIDDQIVWDVVKNKLEDLRHNIEQISAELN